MYILCDYGNFNDAYIYFKNHEDKYEKRLLGSLSEKEKREWSIQVTNRLNLLFSENIDPI